MRPPLGVAGALIITALLLHYPVCELQAFELASYATEEFDINVATTYRSVADILSEETYDAREFENKARSPFYDQGYPTGFV